MGNRRVTATLIVWRFESTDGATAAAGLIGDLVAGGLLDVESGATIRWDHDATRPTVGHLPDLGHPGALSEVFWSLLLGVVFFAPLLAAAVGEPTSGLAVPLHDVGIDEGFVNRVRDQVTPGTSALFVVASDDALDMLADAFAGQGAHAMTATLRAEHIQALRDVFGK